jgi:hypothetical protein
VNPLAAPLSTLSLREQCLLHLQLCNECHLTQDHDVSEFVTSIDAVNMRPPIGPYYDPRAPDWAHFDCARYGCVFECVQVGRRCVA